MEYDEDDYLDPFGRTEIKQKLDTLDIPYAIDVLDFYETFQGRKLWHKEEVYGIWAVDELIAMTSEYEFEGMLFFSDVMIMSQTLAFARERNNLSSVYCHYGPEIKFK